jgi:EF-P beta-lysylation protein EpmB
LNKQDWLNTFDYIAQDGTISEVILSGGDPLNCANAQLEWISTQLEKIPHIKRLRIHTRVPIAIPQRVDSGLLNWLTNCRLQVVMVIHCNHANEIDESVRIALAKLSDIKIPLLNQSVLLAKVNDRADILAELSERLFDCRVQPYYLHLLDKVSGAAHFDLENHKVEQLYRELFEILPGYLVPKLVREVAGAPAKVPALSPMWG